MKEINKDMRNKELIEELISLWENSVKETHSFLSVKEIEDIKQYVPQALKAIEHLIVEFDASRATRFSSFMIPVETITSPYFLIAGCIHTGCSGKPRTVSL